MKGVNTPSVFNTKQTPRDQDLPSPLHLVILIGAITHEQGYRATSSVAAEYAEHLCQLGAIRSEPPFYVGTKTGRIWLNKILQTPCPHLSEIPHGSVG